MFTALASREEKSEGGVSETARDTVWSSFGVGGIGGGVEEREVRDCHIQKLPKDSAMKSIKISAHGLRSRVVRGIGIIGFVTQGVQLLKLRLLL